MNGGDHVINGVILVGNGTLPTGLIANYIGLTGSLSHFKIKNSYFNSAGATYCASLLAYGAPNALDSLTVENILISKNVLVGTSFVAGVIGQANARVRSVARTTGPVSCGYVSSLYGGDVSSNYNTSANAFSLNFMNFPCI